MRRRDFLKMGLGAGAALAFGGGCRLFERRRFDTAAVCPPYEDTIRDRLWMWGHGGTAFNAPRQTYKIPFGPTIEMNEACRFMGIPNVCVCRYGGLPEVKDCAAYLKTFTDIRRIALSVVDNARGTWQEKYELAKRLRQGNPNLGTIWLDDFFTPQALSRPADIPAFRRMLDADGFWLASVLYPDQEGVKPEYKATLSLCDQISVWFWQAKNIPSIRENIRKVRDLVGPEKAILLGIYMWDFGDFRPVPDSLMREQLAVGSELMADGQLSGLVFHPTSIANRNISAVELARAWIAENGDRRI